MRNIKDGGAFQEIMKGNVCVCVCVRVLLPTGHILISSEPGDSGSQQHVQRQSWQRVWMCLDQPETEGKSISLRFTHI